MSFYSGAKFLLAGLIRVVFRVKIIGAENEPDNGAFLICSNHISEADPVILGASLKHNPKYMAKKELMKIPILKQLVTALGAFPIDRGGNDVGAIKKTIEYLKNGESVIMFPQGTRYKGIDPKETEVKSGCALISQKAGVPVLPIFIKTKKYSVLPFRRTYVIIGCPISVNEIMPPDEKSDFKSGAELIFSRINELNKGMDLSK